MTLGVKPREQFEAMPWATELRKLDDLDGARPVGQAANKAAFFERRNQAVDARLGAQIERVLHLVEGRWNSGLLESLMDKTQELSLLACQHRRFLSGRPSSRNKS